MAKGKKTGGRNWKKGQSGNPNGAPVVPAEIKAARKFNKIEFEAAMNKFMYTAKGDLEQFINKDKTSTALEHFAAMMIAKGLIAGDYRCMSFILDRMVEVVQRNVKVTNDMPAANGEIVIIKIPDNGRGDTDG